MPSREQSFVSIASYNVLCDAYIKPEFYPRCDPSAFQSDTRHPLLLERVAGLGTDVICLQEVDKRTFTRLESRLSAVGYSGVWSPKAGGKPDGCAAFVRSGLELTGWLTHEYRDGHSVGPRSGHVVQELGLYTPEGHRLTVLNTHLKWDRPGMPANGRYGLEQARILARMANRGSRSMMVICGDFNAEHGGDVMGAIEAVGFHDAHLANMSPTCVANGKAQKIDAILCNERLLVHDFSTPPIDDATPLPSSTEPSDHVPIVATLVTVDF